MRTRLALWLAVAMALAPTLSSGQVPGMTVDQADTPSGSQYFYGGQSTLWQSYTAGTNGFLGAVDVVIYSSNSADWTATFAVHEGQGTAGRTLASQVVSGGGSVVYCTFNLDVPVRQTSGSQYTFAFTNTSTGLSVRLYANSYAGGRCSQNGSYDYRFHTYVISSDWSEAAYRDTSFTTSTAVISTAAQLAQFAYLVNTGAYNGTSMYWVDLAADINLAGHFWTPIDQGNSGNDCPVFNGNGHAIRSVTINRPDTDYQGLFGGAMREIRDLTVADVDITGRDFVGGLAGSSIATITNCRASGRISGRNHVGGIAGDSRTLYCVNSSTVSGVGMVGGVVGSTDSAANSCSNSGAVGGSTDIGGVVGVGGTLLCDNSGPVTGAVGGARTGGVAGTLSTNAQACRNSGPVTGDASVGGIAGECDGQMNACVNSGAVSGGTAVGGVAGYLSIAKLFNCSNLGAVSATDKVGGLIGSSQGDASNCANTGTVNGVTKVGGLAGSMDDPQSGLVNCENAGGVSGSTSVGGLAGTSVGSLMNSYWKQTGVSPFNLPAAGGGAPILTGCCAFSTAPGTLTQAVTVGGLTTTSLSGALGAFAEANWDTMNSPIRRWTAGTASTYPLPMTAYWTDAGNYDTSWYSDTATQFTIGTAAQLAGLAVLVNGGNSFAGKTVSLSADISLSDHPWKPIGVILTAGDIKEVTPFDGTFDGNGKTLSGLYMAEEGYCPVSSLASLFAMVDVHGTIRNLMVADAQLAGLASSGLTAEIMGSVLNCSISGRFRGVYVSTGIAFNNSGTVANCFSSAQCDSAQAAALVGLNDGVITNSYWKFTREAPYNLPPLGDGNEVVNGRTFAGAPGTLDTSVTIGGVTATNLAAALNAWVNANGGPGSGHYNWTAGTSARYPRLTPIITVGSTPVPQTLTEGFAVETSLTELTDTVATYVNAHPGTTASSFGDVLGMADAMGFKFADLADGQAILNFHPSLVVKAFDRNAWTLTFAVANGVDATATAAMNRLAGSSAALLKVQQMAQPGGAATPLATQIEFHGDGTAKATFNLTNPPPRSFFRLALEHQ